MPGGTVTKPFCNASGRVREWGGGGRVCGMGWGGGGRWVVHVDVDQLCADGRTERRREVARLNAERDRGAGVVDLELLEVERAGVEVGGRRVRVVARTV